MKEFFAFILIGLSGLAIAAFLFFVLQTAGLANYRFFAPKFEDARRQVFEGTQSYHQGSIRDFDNLLLAYTQAKTDDEKAILVETMRHRAAGVEADTIPPRVRALINQ